MKTSYKHLLLFLLVLIALASIFIPMYWEKDSYPKHFLIKRHAQRPPVANIKTMPSFDQHYLSAVKTKIPVAWSIQLVSLQDKKKAVALRNKFREQGYAAFLEQSAKDSVLIRVMVGPYPTKSEAIAVSQKINKHLDMKSIVTEYRTNEVKEIL